MAGLPEYSSQTSLDHKTSSEVTVSLNEANAHKVQGNDHFRSGRWDEAITSYQLGLDHLPKRISKVDAASNTNSDDVEVPFEQEKNKSDEASNSGEDTSPPVESDEYAKARAVLNANIGACYIKLGDHQQAVQACSQALLDDPTYVKALQRRAASNEAINSWSSLTTAQEDYTLLLKLLPPSSALTKEIERSLRLLKPRVEAAQKQETAEMIDKLKGLGNSILGNFGLSTDNFKFEPNGQGGYSMNFTR